MKSENERISQCNIHTLAEYGVQFCCKDILVDHR